MVLMLMLMLIVMLIADGDADADDDCTCQHPPGYLGQPQLEDCDQPFQSATPS